MKEMKENKTQVGYYRHILKCARIINILLAMIILLATIVKIWTAYGLPLVCYMLLAAFILIEAPIAEIIIKKKSGGRWPGVID